MIKVQSFNQFRNVIKSYETEINSQRNQVKKISTMNISSFDTDLQNKIDTLLNKEVEKQPANPWQYKYDQNNPQYQLDEQPLSKKCDFSVPPASRIDGLLYNQNKPQKVSKRAKKQGQVEGRQQSIAIKTPNQFNDFKSFVNRNHSFDQSTQPISILPQTNKDAYQHFIDRSESSEIEIQDDYQDNNLQDLHSKYDLHIDTPSTDRMDNSKYEHARRIELKDVGYGTDQGSQNMFHVDQGISSPLKNPYLKSLEKISKFKMKKGRNVQIKLPSINMASNNNINLPQINSHRAEVVSTNLLQQQIHLQAKRQDSTEVISAPYFELMPTNKEFFSPFEKYMMARFQQIQEPPTISVKNYHKQAVKNEKVKKMVKKKVIKGSSIRLNIQYQTPENEHEFRDALQVNKKQISAEQTPILVNKSKLQYISFPTRHFERIETLNSEESLRKQNCAATQMNTPRSIESQISQNYDFGSKITPKKSQQVKVQDQLVRNSPLLPKNSQPQNSQLQHKNSLPPEQLLDQLVRNSPLFPQKSMPPETALLVQNSLKQLQQPKNESKIFKSRPHLKNNYRFLSPQIRQEFQIDQVDRLQNLSQNYQELMAKRDNNQKEYKKTISPNNKNRRLMKRQYRGVSDLQNADKFNMYGDWLKKISNSPPPIKGQQPVVNLLKKEKNFDPNIQKQANFELKIQPKVRLDRIKKLYKLEVQAKPKFVSPGQDLENMFQC